MFYAQVLHSSLAIAQTTTTTIQARADSRVKSLLLKNTLHKPTYELKTSEGKEIFRED